LLADRLPQPDRVVVDAAEGDDRSAGAFGPEAWERLRVKAVDECGHRQQLGRRDDALAATAVDADGEHVEHVRRCRRRAHP
jgi:hypothetical protein